MFVELICFIKQNNDKRIVILDDNQFVDFMNDATNGNWTHDTLTIFEKAELEWE